MDNKPFNHAGLGGTFDRFHKGHEALLDKAIESARQISIGVTVDDFPFSKKLSTIIQSHRDRVKAIKKFFISRNYYQNINIFPLVDVYGPTLTDGSMDCLVVTNHTKPGAEKINNERKSLGLESLPIVIAELVKDEVGEHISSTRIRQGIIDRKGTYFPNFLNHTLTLSTAQKQQLKEPFGEIISSQKLVKYIESLQPTFTSVVGDRSLITAIKTNLNFQCGIFDNHIQRLPSSQVFDALNNTTYRIIKTKNKQGAINKDATDCVKEAIINPVQLIEVSGEEDLLVIPLIIFQPLNSVIIYGQPNQGLVVIKVTENLKSQIAKLLTN